MSDNTVFDFSNLPPLKKRKEVTDDVRNILILELPGTRDGEMELKKLFEELRDRGYKVKLMS